MTTRDEIVVTDTGAKLVRFYASDGSLLRTIHPTGDNYLLRCVCVCACVRAFEDHSSDRVCVCHKVCVHWKCGVCAAEDRTPYLGQRPARVCLWRGESRCVCGDCKRPQGTQNTQATDIAGSFSASQEAAF